MDLCETPKPVGFELPEVMLITQSAKKIRANVAVNCAGEET